MSENTAAERGLREYPILFSAPMVRALLADQKHVTRRLSKRWLKVKAGDRLWVQEAWWVVEAEGQGIGNQFVVFEDEWDSAEPRPKSLRPTDGHFKWGRKASFHLPRSYSRILLECEEDARLERLQEITAAEAQAEGITLPVNRAGVPLLNISHRVDSHPLWKNPQSATIDDYWTGTFARLWNDLHTKHGERWEDNPEVVRVGRFRCLQSPTKWE